MGHSLTVLHSRSPFAARSVMVDAALDAPAIAKAAVPRSALRKAMQRKSTIAFLMTLPLILLFVLLALYPALYSVHPAPQKNAMERFVGFGIFLFLFKREMFGMLVQQFCFFPIPAVIYKALTTGRAHVRTPVTC